MNKNRRSMDNGCIVEIEVRQVCLFTFSGEKRPTTTQTALVPKESK